MWNELGISGGTAIIILIALYYVIKWAVRNGIKEAYRAITAFQQHTKGYTHQSGPIHLPMYLS